MKITMTIELDEILKALQVDYDNYLDIKTIFGEDMAKTEKETFLHNLLFAEIVTHKSIGVNNKKVVIVNAD